MAQLVFEKQSIKKLSATGTLTWGSKTFQAITGGFGKGALPDGNYEVKTRNVVDANLESGFKTANAEFFIPLSPKDDVETERKGFGIHPDGNKTGTLGCIGLADSEAKKFWNLWIKTKLSERPTTLIVRTKQTISKK